MQGGRWCSWFWPPTERWRSCVPAGPDGGQSDQGSGRGRGRCWRWTFQIWTCGGRRRGFGGRAATGSVSRGRRGRPGAWRVICVAVEWVRCFSPIGGRASPCPIGTCETGRARLSYDYAARLFKDHSGGWTLHQLRHSSLTDLAAMGANVAQLQAKSRHRSRSALETYTTLGDAAVSELTAWFDRPRGVRQP